MTVNLTADQIAGIERIRQEIVAAGETNSAGGPRCGVTSEEVGALLPGACENYGAFRRGETDWPAHAWVYLADGTIVDPTADQFGFEPIRVIPPGDPRAQDYLDHEGTDWA